MCYRPSENAMKPVFMRVSGVFSVFFGGVLLYATSYAYKRAEE